MDITTNGVYIITGGAGAVAGSVARVFHAAGARLALVGRDESALRQRAEPLGALALGADLASPEAAEHAFGETLRVFGRIDGLIHTAGGFEMAPADESDAALYDRLFDMNMRTLFCAVHAVLPQLLSQRDGFVAGFSAGLVRTGGGAGMTVYAAAKAAVSAYLRALESEVRSSGVRVAVVYPLGTIDTPRNRLDMPGADPRGWVDPEEIGQALLFAATRGPRGALVELAVGVRG
jgi:NADP-dependent 3-hydroxy acid dehydrogenase YdfG